MSLAFCQIMVYGILLACAMLTEVNGHSTYVPQEACVNMWPKGHNTEAQTTDSPYVISVNSTTYTRGSAIEVFVNATGAYNIDFYEGILLQVRHAVPCGHDDIDKQVGTFSLLDGEDFLNLMSCTKSGDTIAHKAHMHIYNRTFIWNVPNDLTGPVVMKATIARRKVTFWTNVHSAYITDPTNESMEPTICDKGSSFKLSVGLMIWTMIIILA